MHAYANLRKPPNPSKIQIEALQVLCPQTETETDRQREREEACNNYRQRRRFMDCPLPPFLSPPAFLLLFLRCVFVQPAHWNFFLGHFACGAHTFSRRGALHICLAFDLIYTQFLFFPSFVYFFPSDFCLIFFVVGASAKFMSQLENSGNICSQHISTSILANSASTVGWRREEPYIKFSSPIYQSNTRLTRSSL